MEVHCYIPRYATPVFLLDQSLDGPDIPRWTSLEDTMQSCMAVVGIARNLIFNCIWLTTSARTLQASAYHLNAWLLLSHLKQLQHNGFHVQMMVRCHWGEETEVRGGWKTVYVSFSQLSISQEHSVTDDPGLQQRIECNAPLCQCLCFPCLTSTHRSLLSVLPAYCSGIVQHIWQAKGKAAFHCILFLLFKVHSPNESYQSHRPRQ